MTFTAPGWLSGFAKGPKALQITLSCQQATLWVGAFVALAGTIPSVPARGEEIFAAQGADRSSASDLRVATVGYRLSAANASQCPVRDVLTGLLLHEPGGYPLAYRSEVSILHGFTGGFGIRAVVPGSAGARAGLMKGDEILALEGSDLRTFRQDLVTRAASYNRVEAFLVLLTTALGRGDARLEVLRDGESISLSLQGEPGCGGRTAIVRGQGRRAWTDGAYIAVTPGMADFTRSDDELAFVVAHEMAHNILDRTAARDVSALMATLGMEAMPSRGNELNADAIAVGLMARAGYDPSMAEELLVRLRSMRPLDVSLTHPGLKRRIAAIRAAIAGVRTNSAR